MPTEQFKMLNNLGELKLHLVIVNNIYTFLGGDT